MTFKKIYSLFALAIVAAGLAACSDDDAGSEYLHQSQVSITSSSITFTAKADTGSVDFTAPAGATATASISSSWATATVDGNTVHVAVQNNPNLEGRSALLTIKAGTDSANVTVQQQGMAYSYNGERSYAYSDSARQTLYPLTNEGGTVNVETPDWITATVGDNGLNVSLAENTTGGIRSGNICLQNGPYTDTIQVVQGELKDIVNKEYIFQAYDLAQNIESNNPNDYLIAQEAYVLADTIPYADTTYVIPVIYIPEENYVIPFEFEQQDLLSLVPGGIQVGTYARRYYLYTAIVDPDVYNALAQSDDSYPSLMASDYMYMLGMWGSTPEYGNVAVFDSYSGNLRNWMGQLFSNLTSYDGYILGIFAFNSRLGEWITDDGMINTDNMSGFVGALNFYAFPALIEYGQGAGAKPTVLPIGNRRNAPATTAELQRDLQYIKAAKLSKATSAPKSMKLNSSSFFNPQSRFDYMNKFNLNIRK